MQSRRLSNALWCLLTVVLAALFCPFQSMAATISGVVSSGGGLAVANVCVYAHDAACGGNWMGGAQTNVGGAYSFTVDPGTYYLSVDVTCGGNTNLNAFYVSGSWTSAGMVYHCSAAEAFSVDTGQTVVKNFQLQEGGKITGNVSASDSSLPVLLACVNAVASPCDGGQWLMPTPTDGLGNYSLTVPPGNYYLITSPSCFGSGNTDTFYANEWWNSGSGTYNCNLGAESFDVAALQTYPNHNFSVDPGAKLSGAVTAADTAAGLAGACVNAVENSCSGYWISSSNTDADGNYTVLVPPGSYYLRASPSCNNSNSATFYVDEWWTATSGALTCSGAQLETVNAWEEKTYDFVVPKGAKIVGHVTAEQGGQSITDVCVQATEPFCGGFWHTPSRSDSSGFYSLLVPEGSYFLYANPSCAGGNPQNYLAEWWNSGSGSPGCDGAAAVTVGSGDIGTSLTRDFALGEGFTVSGRVTSADTHEGLANVCVNAMDGCGGTWQGGGSTDSQGYYSFNLTAGTYYIGLDLTCGGNNPPSVYISEWWDGGEGSPICSEASALDLTSGAQTGIDFALARGGLIGGRVTTIDGTPVEGLWVHAWSSPCWTDHLGGDFTDADGEYWITAPAGSAYVQTCASCNHQNYEDKWWDEYTGTIDCAAAMPVQAVAGDTVAGVDFVLHAAPQVLSYFEVGPYGGNLHVSFDVAPSFRKLIRKATVVGPKPTNKRKYNFDLANDFFDMSSECGYFLGWDKDLGPVEAEDFGDYTLTLTLFDGSVRTYHDVVQDRRSEVPGPVDSNTMNATVNDDGSIDFQWAWPSEPWPKAYYYRVRIRSEDGQHQYYSSGILAKGDPQLHVPAGSLTCLARGQDYRWFVRIMDSQWPYNIVWDSERILMTYDTDLATQRTSYFDVWQWDGKLALGFEVRPGSWGDINSATVAGPGGFVYLFDLVDDWDDISTETRTNRSWWKELDPPFVFGEYTLQVEFKDGRSEQLAKTISAVSLIPLVGSSLSQTTYADGAMTFNWQPGPGAANQKYNVRVRNLDGSSEYVRTPNAVDASSAAVTFWNLRTLDFGDTFDWFVRFFDQQNNTMATSESASFVYNPFNYPLDWLQDTDGDGMNDGWEKDHGLNDQVPDGDGDADGDLLSNRDEYRNDTDPHVQDSDTDGMKDKWEVDNWLNPTADDALADADGDGFNNRMEYIHKTDPNDPSSRPITTTGVFRPDNGQIYLKKENSTGFADASLVYGIRGDIPVAGDWDGDGVTGIGIYRDGQFFLKHTIATGYADMVIPFGQNGDMPVVGDWDGNGTDTIGIFRNGQFLLRNSNSTGPPDYVFYLGTPQDLPIAGNWDGAGGDSCGVFRPTDGFIYLKNELSTGFADVSIFYGIALDKPVIGDWDGDHVDTIGVYRNGAFLLRNSNETGWAEIMFWLGQDLDVPISGKWALP